ncbi:MAG: DUF5667 domain-containing protein [Parcubacteria group bacterium]
MKKTIIITLTIALIAFASPVFAQEGEPSAGTTPASPFFFVERFFEGVGTFFTFGNSAKAERYLALAAERLAEAKVLAEEGNEQAVAAVALYEEQYAKAKERAERIAEDTDGNGGLDRLAQVTDATTRHLAVLDEVYEKVPEEAKASIQAAKERSMTGQIEALRGIAQRDPEAAVDIFARAAEGRLMAAQARAGAFIKFDTIEGEAVAGDDSDGDGFADALEEFERYAEFGKEISTLAEGLQTGETTVEQLVERATSHHRDILLDIQSKAPQQAQDAIRRALKEIDKMSPKLIERAAPVQTGRPTESVPQRSIPENSIERTDTENENGAGGPPAGTVPSYPSGRP